MMKGKRALPLLVKIQNIDISELDFHLGNNKQSGANAKSRHVTFVDATNLYLCVGSSSGTVYLFSRESLKLLIMIPFMGGKVCHIALSPEQTEVAVASIRGRVSLYSISSILHLHHGNNKGAVNKISSFPAEAFQHLHDMLHHVENEITEMTWSPNGNFLFIGDNHGIVSQFDRTIQEEFPRPPPSRVILKLQSRILQIDCAFPYLAICTLTASYLCNLEKEDFTRIISPDTKSDIKAAGLQLLSCDNNYTATTSRSLSLFLCGLTEKRIYNCKMDGTVRFCDDVKLASAVKSSAVLFDPSYASDDSPPNFNNPEEINFSPGKMYSSSSSGFLVTVSNDKLFVFDPQEDQSGCGNIILWNDSFKKINSFKFVENYGFVWNGNKVGVFAITQFRSYGEQLWKSGLNSVLERWVNHAVNSVGYRHLEQNGDQETSCTKLDHEHVNEPNEFNENSFAVQLFRRMMSSIEDDNNFCDYVINHLPFALIEPEPHIELSASEFSEMLKKSVNNLVTLSASIETNNSTLNEFKKRSKFIEQFYEEIGATLPQLDNRSELTLVQVLQMCKKFHHQSLCLEINATIRNHSLQTCIQDNILVPMLSIVNSLYPITSCDFELDSEDFSEHLTFYFLRYAKSPLVTGYFKELGISASFDALLADTILLLFPLIDCEKIFFSLMDTYLNVKARIHSLCFTWVISLTIMDDKTHGLPFGTLLRPIQNPQIFEKVAEEILQSIYRDILAMLPHSISHMEFSLNQERSEDHETLLTMIKLFPNLISFVILFSKHPEIKQRGIELLLELFPMKQSSAEDITRRIIGMCALSPIFMKMLQKACLEDGNSLSLCSCGLPACYGLIERKIVQFQRVIEEAILSMFIEDYLSSDQSNLKDNIDFLKLPVHVFAMKRCLLNQYLESTVSDEILSDQKKIRVIFTSGLCSGLKFLKFNLDNLKVLQQYASRNLEEKCCICECSMGAIKMRTKMKFISMDCVGIWAAESVGSIDNFIKVVKNLNLNSRGKFSLRFYRFLVTRDLLLKSKKQDSGFGNLVSLSNLSCSCTY